MVKSAMVEASHFYELSVKYQVSGVPHTAINANKGVMVGAAPEEHLINEIKSALRN